MTTAVGKVYHFCAGHRLTKHTGKCRNLHGHNYKVKVEIESGELNNNDMVIDFYDIDKIVSGIVEKYDHTYLVNKTDEAVIRTCQVLNVPFVPFDTDPTAEVIAQDFYDEIERTLSPEGLSITVWETEKCYAKV